MLPFLSAMATTSAPNAVVDQCEHDDENVVQRAVLVAAQVSAPDLRPDCVPAPSKSCRVLQPCRMHASLLSVLTCVSVPNIVQIE